MAISLVAVHPVVVLAQPGESCRKLTSLRIPDTTIESAAVIEDGNFNPPGATNSIRRLPPFCRVTGITRPAIGFEVWMPLGKWTGRFEVVGNGGMAGTISYGSMAAALRRGNATASTNTGHITQPTGSGFDASWSLNRPELVEDFGHRALHLTTVNGKQIAREFYRKSVNHSYYVGCSKGGGQGLMEAQRYPGDFDGIVAGDPAYNWTRLYAGAHLYYAMSTLKDPESYIQPAKVKLLADAVNQACDAKDGFTDGVLDDPLACHFDPAVLACKQGQDPGTCFTPKQVKAVKDIWAGSHDDRGRQIFPGLVPGGEGGSGGWQSWVTGSAPFHATHWKAADSFFRFMVMGDPNYDPMTFDYDRDKGALDRLAPALDAIDANLRPFERRGAKLILYHGWSDPDISPLNTIHYYKAMEQATGPGTSNFARLFLVPGMQHCGGGPGTDSFDAVSAIERWVEKGVAPVQIVASHSTHGVVDRTRPLCPYPQMAVFSGKGNPNDAANFVCRVQQVTEGN
ncbi:tannase/feruloyl esterase family alpha/beta hydrolase [Edaphobacter modestus]|uniref:tannase/feruloyl esterase family alpha/beta hydrolase n=1 Tax=Edaphobacter modestus TaxID=388466 RepID=UPI0013EE413A|nr:tannase/feruloyl esterase family alpha/beta hydrolase [Edaphobacter modestus]